MPTPGIEPATPYFPACHSNHSAIGRDIDMLLGLLQYFFIKRYYKNCVSCAKDIQNNKNKLTLFTYSFVIDTIKIQDDSYKRRFCYVLYVNDYI